MKLKLLLIGLIFPYFLYSQSVSRKESLQSLRLQIYNDTTQLGYATGFIIRSKSRYYLVTNYHVVTYKNASTGEWINKKKQIVPNNIAILFHAKDQKEGIRGMIPKWQPLLDKENKPLWHENKIGKEMVDVIELEITDTLGIRLDPVPYKNEYSSNLLLQPLDRIFIVGYPLGAISSPVLPIWKSGLIASEPQYDQDNKPMVWVDAVTFQGMSGSPAYLISEKIKTKKGLQFINKSMKSILVGVFSNQGDPAVYCEYWKIDYLRTIFDGLP